MFISLMWDVKEPIHYSKTAGHEVPSVVAVLCECMGGYREGDMPRMGLSDPFAYHLALRCKRCKNKNKTCSRQLLNLVLAGFISWSMISLSYTAVVIHPL